MTTEEFAKVTGEAYNSLPDDLLTVYIATDNTQQVLFSNTTEERAVAMLLASIMSGVLGPPSQVLLQISGGIVAALAASGGGAELLEVFAEFVQKLREVTGKRTIESEN